MAVEHSAGLVGDTNFWVLVSTAIFVFIAYKKGRKPILDMLDSRTAKIKAELEEAERLRIEAQDLLSECQKKHRDAIQTAQKIIDNAHQTTKRLEEESQTKLEENLKRREEQLLDRISRAEAAAVQELRDQAADIASRTAEILLEEALTKKGGKLVDDAIAELPKRLSA